MAERISKIQAETTSSNKQGLSRLSGLSTASDGDPVSNKTLSQYPWQCSLKTKLVIGLYLQEMRVYVSTGVFTGVITVELLFSPHHLSQLFWYHLLIAILFVKMKMKTL